ncbi:DUF2878 domain-containing protein [Colwelliaceae bacterium 6441]
MLLNIIGFNLSWFGLVMIGNSYIPFTLIWLAMHVYCCKQPLAELKLLISITIIGTAVDSLLQFFDVLVFTDRNSIPLWLVMLWCAFAATIAHSLQFLRSSIKLQWLVGYIFPPLSYLAGSHLSAVEFGYDLAISFIVLGTIWSLLFVLFFRLKETFYLQESTNA